MKKKNLRLRRKKQQEVKIVIDQDLGLVFASEKELIAYFSSHIEKLENEFASFSSKEEPWSQAKIDLEEELDFTLDSPAEIWNDEKTFSDFPVFMFIRPLEKHEAYHVAVTYVNSQDEPTFIFLHFVTGNLDVVNEYRRGELVYDRSFEEVGFAMLEGDSLSEGDPLSMGLFIAMLKVRSDKDVPFAEFQNIGSELREDTIEAADEIWRSSDLRGNRIVTFIKEFPDHEVSDLTYLAVTLEDPGTHVHNLLFSFPTNDTSLVDRYRHGENLQAEEVSQESSH